ncbi:MAG: RelA/SpoT family protein [Candidatus Uhrbacteria bacterium]
MSVETIIERGDIDIMSSMRYTPPTVPMLDLATITYRERLLDEVRHTLPHADNSAIERAANFAIEAHGDQRRLSGMPYVTHVLETGRKLAAMQLADDVIIAGILHDVHEDADVSLETIASMFNRDVAKLVAGVTKVGKVRYRGEERYVENLRKMFVALADDVRVMFIKFADRLHNLEDLEVVPEAKRRRIAREALEIYAPIANRLGMMEMKAQLEDSAFTYVNPEESQWIDSLISASYKSKRKLCNELTVQARAILDAHRIPYIATMSRMKSRYSLYQKLLKHQRDLSQIHDLVALRIVVPDIPDCYTALSALHRRWTPVHGRIKDYIANPKTNGYQSIHTTVLTDSGEIVEFQIRTEEMHEEAQWGAAAVWRYHEHGVFRPSEKQLQWVDELVEWQRSIQDPQDFISGLKLDVLCDRILVFTPKGDVIELPEGATPLDFAYAIHSEVGNTAMGARVNGNTALYPLDKPLTNGDLIEIICDPKRKGPSMDWLGVVRTTQARTKIKDALRSNARTRISDWNV